MLVIGAGSHKMFDWIVNRALPDQTASSKVVWSVSALFVYAFSEGNLCMHFLTFTIQGMIKHNAEKCHLFFIL